MSVLGPAPNKSDCVEEISNLDGKVAEDKEGKADNAEDADAVFSA